jgi:hypothetical protein
MSFPQTQELQPNPSYLSGYTFFTSSDVQTFISELTPLELAYTFMHSPNHKMKTQYIHELWRTGRMEVVYEFFNLPERVGSIGDEANPTGDQLTETDIIDNCKQMMSTGMVGEEECIAFVKDLCWASANAHDNQEYGEEPQDLTAVVERTMRIMTEIRT